MQIEIRNDHVVIQGYINAVGRESRILPSPRGRFKEIIVPKTFERALQKAKSIDLLFNHKKDRKLGSTAEGNLSLYEDNIGLRGIATVYDPEVIEKAKKNSLKGWSFGFVENRSTWGDSDQEGVALRKVEDLDLLEVSILDLVPAYVATSIEARGDQSCVAEQRIEEEENHHIINREDKKDNAKDNADDEKNEERTIDYSLFEKEIMILSMKGS